MVGRIVVAGTVVSSVPQRLCQVTAARCPEERFAEVSAEFAAARYADVCVVAEVHEPYRGPWPYVADVVFGVGRWLPCSPRRWIAGTLEQFPGSAMAAVDLDVRGVMVGIRGSGLLGITAPTGKPAPGPLAAAVVHGLLACGTPVASLAPSGFLADWRVEAFGRRRGRCRSFRMNLRWA